MKQLFLLLILALGTLGCEAKPWQKIDHGQVISIIPHGDSHVEVYAEGSKQRYRSMYYAGDCYFRIGDKINIYMRDGFFSYSLETKAEQESKTTGLDGSKTFDEIKKGFETRN